MKKLLVALVKSFYSATFYRRVARDWSGSGIGMLALFLLLATILISVMTGATIYALRGSYSDYKESLLSQVPKMTLDNGVLSISEPSPYYITLHDQPVVMIDTSDSTNYMSMEELQQVMKDYKLMFLITKTNIISEEEDGGYSVQPLSKFNKEDNSPLQFDQFDARKLVHWMEIYVPPLMIVIMYLTMLVVTLIQLFVCSLAGVLANRILRVDLDYAQVLRITACAMLPGIIISMFITIPFAGIGITIGYTLFGVASARGGSGLTYA